MAHVFGSVAPEDNPDGLSSTHLETWKWCIRCGVLKLGRMYFVPGPSQKRVFQQYRAKGVPPCFD